MWLFRKVTCCTAWAAVALSHWGAPSISPDMRTLGPLLWGLEGSRHGDFKQRMAASLQSATWPSPVSSRPAEATLRVEGSRGSMDIRRDSKHMAVKLLECEFAADHNQDDGQERAHHRFRYPAREVASQCNSWQRAE